MQNYFKNRRFLSIFLLISIAVFLVFPKISLAEDFEKITPEIIKKYLELPEKDIQSLLFALKQVFTTDWIYRESSGFSTVEECLVPLVLRKIITIQALNHLLIDAPIQITWAIVKNSTKIAKVFLTKDPSGILNELEKESVKRAVEYGMNFLFQNEIRVTPGAIEYAYISQKGIEQKIIIQYILIYQPLNNRHGNVIIRFYSPQPIDPPKSEGAWGMTGTPHSVQGKLPPFIVEIRGTVEDYKWTGKPSMEIDFPSEVPDLGIKPLTFWERHLLKPIESTIKEIEIIITKVTGISPKIVENLFNIPKIVINIWNEIKSTFSKINPFSPAALVQAPVVEREKPPVEVGQGVGQEVPEGEKVETLETKPQIEPKPEPKPLSSLEKMQEDLDDIAERIDIMSQEVAKFLKEKGIKGEEKIEEEEKDEEIEELEEKEDAEKKEGGICIVNINTASKEELQKIIGVGPTIAQKIIKARPFYSLNDLMRVSGIGEKTLQKIINQGCAYVDSTYTNTGSGPATASSSVPSPQITLNYSGENPVNKEIKTALSVSNLKNSTYDVKISIEKEGVFSEICKIYNQEEENWQCPEDQWQSSNYYLTEVFASTSFSGSFKLRIKKEKNNFKGEADIVVKIRQSDNNKIISEFKGKINITDPEPEPKPEQPQLPQTIVINEIAWMGTKASASDEWIEFYNPGDSEVDITNWSIDGADTEECLNFSDAGKNAGKKTTIIPPGGYLIYADHETDVQDSTRTNIVDIWNSAVGMNNTSPGQLILYDALNCQGNIIDIANQPIGNWFAGKASPDYISMERIDSQESGSNSENWRDNNLIIVNGIDKDKNQILGTPKAKNSVTYQPPITLPQLINWDLTLTTLYSPYIVQGTVNVFQNMTLTIEPGVVLKFMPQEGNNDSQLNVLGTLRAIGTPEKKIIFTSFLDDLNDLEELENLKDIEKDTNQDGNSTVPYPGAWKWISFGSREPNINPTLDSELSNVLIRYGDTYDAGVIKVEKGSSITLKNSRLEKNKRGIWLVGSPSTLIDGVEFINNNFLAVQIQNGGSPTIKNSRFEGKGGDQIGIIVGAGTAPLIENNFFTKNKTPILVETGSAPVLQGNQGENNQLNGIVMSPSGGFHPEGVNEINWLANKDFPYIIEDSWRVNSGITLKIEPGTVIKFGSLFPIYWADRRNAYLEIQGRILAEGTEGNQIVFTSLRDDEYSEDTNNDDLPRPEEQGPDWKGIVIKSQASATLKWLKIRYAGAEPLAIEAGADVDQENIIIE